jgi:transposase
MGMGVATEAPARQKNQEVERMRFAGIDIGAERHVVAVVIESGEVLRKPVAFGEDAAGYRRLRELLGAPDDCLVAMEATGGYWRNLFGFLVAEGFSVAVINPLRTRRFAEEDLQRTKTDAIDALGIARFAQQKRPSPTSLSEPSLAELRDLVRLRQQTVQQLGDRVRQLHRTIHSVFPEFHRLIRRRLETELATAILLRYPTAVSFSRASITKLARIRYDGSHYVGEQLARALITTAKISVAQHHSEPLKLQVRYACRDINVLRQRMCDLEADIERRLDAQEIGKLLTSIDGIGPQAAAIIIAEVGDPARFRSVGALASYVGVTPRIRQSGKRQFSHGGATPLGNARLRSALWMPTLAGIRCNPWLRRYYWRLRTAGKRPKVALLATMHKLLAAIYSVAKHRQPFVLPLVPPFPPAAVAEPEA